MALTYGFYNAVNHDRTYDAIQMSSIFDGIIKDGIFQSIGTAMIPTATGTDMNVNVGIGRAWFNHTWTLNDAILPVEVPESEVVLDRIDALVLEVNAEDTVRANDIKIIKGTPSSEPVRPTLTNTLTIHQYALAYVSVKAGVTVIEQADITNMIGSENTPFITGILETVDTEQLILQWQNQWDNWMRDTTAEESTWFATMRAEFDTWATGQRADFAEWSTEQKADFEAWEETIRDILDQGAAGHLQNEIDALAEVVEANTHLVHLKVSYDSAALTVGTNITVTNGDESYTEAVTEGSNYIIFNCNSLGTWTVTEDLYNTTSTVETTYYGNYETTAGGKIFITVTYDEMFYGALLTLSNGVKSYTKTAPALTSGVLFVVAETGTWTVSATVESRSYSTSINIPSDGNYEMMLNASGFDLEDWLEAGGVTGTYEDLDAVLADEKALRQLFTKHASVDYLVDACSTELVEDVETIINNDHCAKWINLRDYALDTLYANEYISEAMDAADKYFYGEWALLPQVPKMTSNTAPYGTVISSAPFSTYYAWKAFDKNNGTGDAWLHNGNGANSAYIGYQFVNPIICKRVKITNWSDNAPRIIKSFKIQGSNDGTNWIDLTQETQNTGGNVKSAESIYEINNDNAYLYYRLFVISVYDTTYCGVGELQFYSWQPKGNVPVMTSNNAPYGMASASKAASSYPAYEAFDNIYNTSGDCWDSGTTSGTEWLAYKFVNPVCVRRFVLNVEIIEGIAYLKTYKIQASNDNFVNDVHDLYSGEINNIDTSIYTIDINNDDFYISYRILCLTSYTSKYIIRELQFYGRELKVSVPTMTSNTEPWGEVSASSYYTGNAANPWKSFNGLNTMPGWQCVGEAKTCWIQYKFTKPVNIRRIKTVGVTFPSDDQCGYILKLKIQGSNDNTNFVDLETILYDGIAGEIKDISLNASDTYSIYRLQVLDATVSNITGFKQVQFYGLDYSEHEERHWIYDHGVELEELTIHPPTSGGVAEKQSDQLYLTSTVQVTGSSVSTWTYIYASSDLTDYSLVRAHNGNEITPHSNSNYSVLDVVNSPSSVDGVAYSRYLTQNIPYMHFIDISDVNGNKFLRVTAQKNTDNQVITITEWWLE